MKVLSDDHKKAISDGIKLAHLEERHPGWQNANRKHRSYPEKLFDRIAEERKFFEKYDVIRQYPFHGYFFDYAVVDCMIDIEIDGVQHYRTEKAIEYDKLRNDFVMSKGWRVYRISAKELKDNPIREVEELLKFIDSEKKYRCYSREDLLKYFNGRTVGKYGTRKAYRDHLAKEYEEENKKFVAAVLSSNIDFSKFGWVKEVAPIIEKRTQKVKNWMKRFMPDFYEAKCFKKITLKEQMETCTQTEMVCLTCEQTIKRGNFHRHEQSAKHKNAVKKVIAKKIGGNN